jgi:hypothetical protein
MITLLVISAVFGSDVGVFPLAPDFLTQSMAGFSVAIAVQTATMYLESTSLTWLNHTAILGSLAFYLIISSIVSSTPSLGIPDTMPLLLGQLSFYLTLILVTTFITMIWLCMHLVTGMLRPSSTLELQKRLAHLSPLMDDSELESLRGLSAFADGHESDTNT